MYIIKGVMPGKLIAVAYTLRTIETSSLLADFVNKNRCISVRLVSEDNSHNSFLWPEYFIDFFCERWIPCQACITSLYIITSPYLNLKTTCSKQLEGYNPKIKILTLKNIWKNYNKKVARKMWIRNNNKDFSVYFW